MGVHDQVTEYLGESFRVDADRCVGAVDADGGVEELHEVDEPANLVGDGDGFRADLEEAGVEAGGRQQIVHDTARLGGLAHDHLDCFPILSGRERAAEQVGEPDDPGERRAQAVGHVGEGLVLDRAARSAFDGHVIVSQLACLSSNVVSGRPSRASFD